MGNTISKDLYDYEKSILLEEIKQLKKELKEKIAIIASLQFFNAPNDMYNHCD